MQYSARRAVGRVLIASVIIVVVALSGVGFVLYEQTAIKPNTVSMELSFTPAPTDAPLYYGLAEGIYKQNDINLTIIPGTNQATTLAALEAGKVDFAEGNPQVVVDLYATDNVTNLRIVAMEYARSNLVVIYNNASVTSLADLNGKAGSMASPTQGDILGEFKLFAKANGLNTTSMNLQFNPVATSNDLLLDGKVQFIVTAAQNLGTLYPAAESAGIKLGYFTMSDYGLSSAGAVIVTTETMIQQSPTIVRDFVKATMESFVQAYSNQALAVGDLVKSNPQLNESSSLQSYQMNLNCCSLNPSNLTSSLQYGWINPQFMQQTVNTEIIADNLGITLNATTIYTNEFVLQP